MCVGLWTNEWTPWCQSQSGINRINRGRVFPWRRRQRRASFHRQYFPFHSGLFRSVCSVRPYSLCRRLSTYFGNWFGSSLRTHHNHQKGLDYFRVGYLCACRWSDWSCTCHYFRTFGCNNCPFKSTYWVGNLSSCGSLGFHFQNVESSHCRRKVFDFLIKALLSSQRSVETLIRLQILTRYYCYFGYGRTFRGRQIDRFQS